MLWSVIVLLIIGFVSGLLARALVPGDDSMSILMTTVLGIVGSFIGGLLGYLIFGADLEQGAVQASGIVGSVLGAIIALLIYRAVSGRRPVFGQ